MTAAKARLEQLKRWCEQVMRRVDLDDLIDPDDGEAFVVDKDHSGPPGSVVIRVRHKSGLTEHWKLGVKDWYVAKTELPQ